MVDFGRALVLATAFLGVGFLVADFLVADFFVADFFVIDFLVADFFAADFFVGAFFFELLTPALMVGEAACRDGAFGLGAATLVSGLTVLVFDAAIFFLFLSTEDLELVKTSFGAPLGCRTTAVFSMMASFL